MAPGVCSNVHVFARGPIVARVCFVSSHFAVSYKKATLCAIARGSFLRVVRGGTPLRLVRRAAKTSQSSMWRWCSGMTVWHLPYGKRFFFAVVHINAANVRARQCACRTDGASMYKDSRTAARSASSAPEQGRGTFERRVLAWRVHTRRAPGARLSDHRCLV